MPAGLLSANESGKRERKKPQPFVVSYVGFVDDAYYQKTRAYTGVTLKRNVRPLNGVKAGIRGARIIGRSTGVEYKIVEHDLDSSEDYVTSVVEQLDKNRSKAVVLDLPKKEMLEVAAALSAKPVVLFNVRHTDDDLRGQQCLPQLFHTLPSRSMLVDALNQYLKDRRWNNVLLLTGSSTDDLELSQAYKKSAKKFSLKIVAEKPFVLGNDPRDRTKTNISLLTSRPKHDVIFVADTLGEYARYVPYQTYYPRPVVGSEGLTSAAWHWSWERYGAPQLNQRFKKKFETDMTPQEWAGWVAVRALTSAARLAGSIEYSPLIAALSSPELVLDVYKGGPGNFRSWDNQLRQPILLHTHNAVIARAPMDSFLHHRNTLDTLGTDEVESDCVW